MLMIIGLSSSVSSDTTNSPLRTKNFKRIDVFKPKFVKILTADEIKQSNVKLAEKRKPIVHHLDIGEHYASLGTGLLQNVYTVEEIPRNQIKATIHCKSPLLPKNYPGRIMFILVLKFFLYNNNRKGV